MGRLRLFVGAMFFALALAMPAKADKADFADDQRLCYGNDPNLDARIAACTRQIALGKWQGHGLAIWYNNRGNAYRSKGDIDRAIADYSEAIHLDPKYASPYNGRGNVYQDKKDYDRAIADYDQAIRLDPKYALAYNGRGMGD